ncbi:MAG: PEP-CTERM sorting domain-containing protein [Nitrospirota bacterium]|nr:PEP-CTERM sorting domain-containing protein [Nitrospirota bacterium]
MVKFILTLSTAAFLAFGSTSFAGPIFLTGHDPDFHAQDSNSAKNLLKSGLGFVTGGSYINPGAGVGTLTLGAGKFLWVEGRVGDALLPSLPGGHRIGEAGLGAIGLTLGTHYDRANGADFSALSNADLSSYSAIAIASTFGGLLTKAELDALNARKTDIETFFNAGGGLLALSESLASQIGGIVAADLFGFLPVTVSSIAPVAPFTVTAAGAASPYNLFTSDLNDPTHNSFGLIGGLTALDLDSGSPKQATTLAGIVTIGGGGFTPPGTPAVPEPSTILLFGSGLAGLGLWRYRKSGKI